MRIAENYSSVKTIDLPVDSAWGSLGTLSEVGTYTISFTYVVHSGEAGNGFLIRGATSIGTIPPSEGRTSFTFEVDTSNAGTGLRLYSGNQHATSIKNHVTFHDVHIASGTQEPDIWTPAHADLTPEQIATLPPYGEYKEIQTF